MALFILVVMLAMSRPCSSQKLHIGRHLTEFQQRHLEEEQRSHVEEFYGYSADGTRGMTVATEDDDLEFENDRLKKAYIALQAWKKAIFSDPFNYTATWVGPDVCSYKGVFCADALDDPCVTTVGGIDFNHADIAGYLPEELGLLSDLGLFHISSNRLVFFNALMYNILADFKGKLNNVNPLWQ